MIEIERKYLVKSNAYRKKSFKKYEIIQGFLNSEKQRTVRVRLKNEKGYLTIKGISSKDGLERFEWEREIPKLEAEALLNLCETPLIQKIRFEVKCGNHIFEIDEFIKENEGLVIAELELQNREETFLKPNWLGEEVTGDIKYYNSNLISNPYKNWKDE